jgi:UDP-N-acetylmuramate dehydrogenase
MRGSGSAVPPEGGVVLADETAAIIPPERQRAARPWRRPDRSPASGDVSLAGMRASSPAIDILRVRLNDRVRVDEPLSRHTSLRVGGPAEVFVRAESVDDVRLALRHAAGEGLPVLVLGGGSNVLVSDRGIPGMVLSLGRGFDYVRRSTEGAEALVAVGAGARSGRVARRTVAAGLSGFEFAEGIPGTIGGALWMNAGAYGGDMAGVVDAVSGVTAEGLDGRFERDALRFGYRQVALPAGFVVLEVALRLRVMPVAALRVRLAELRQHREQAQPQGSPSAGSMFKNPPGYHAGRLIDAAGLKGTRIGAMQISERHGNFFVNLGGAQASDVKALMDLAQRVVWERFQVRLEPEVRLVGSW